VNIGDPAAEQDRREQADEADRRHLADPAGTQVAAVKAHHDGHRHGREDGEGPPRAVGERLDDDQGQHGEQNDHNRQYPDHRDHPRNVAHLAADDLAQRAAVAPGRDEQNDQVLDGAGENHAGENPERAGQIAHLRRQHRPDQGPRAGNGREMVAEQDDAVGRDVIEPVVAADRRGRARRIDAQDAARDEAAVESVADQVDADCGYHQPERVDRLAAAERDHAERDGAERGQHRPQRGPAGRDEFRARHSLSLFCHLDASREGAGQVTSSRRRPGPQGG
jgi:hypothetical protein